LIRRKAMSEHRTCLVDMHCHLDLYPDPAGLLRSIDAAEVYTVAVTNAPSVFPHTKRLTEKSRHVRPAIGLHPELVKTHAGERPLFWQYLAETRYVGEVGLDHVTTDSADRSLQREVFAEVLERCAAAGSKVLTVHSRRAASTVIDMVGKDFPCVVVLHWFSGSVREATRAAANGLYFSVNPAMVRSKSGQALIECMDPDRVLTETDGPFVSLGKTVATPPDVSVVVRHLASVWQISEEAAAARVFATLRRVLPNQTVVKSS
jgi:TatD DNase family protein